MKPSTNRPRIVVIGSLNMDLVVSMERMPQIGETILGTSIHYIPGGKGANQAVGCSYLGADVVMIGAVGNDQFGQRIISEMQRFGVKTDRITIMEGTPTGTATIMLTKDDNCIVVVPGANAFCSAEQVNQYEEAIRYADVLLVQLEIPISTVEQALSIARAHGVKTILNPAPAQVLSDQLLKLVDYITPNETEFELLSRANISSDQALETEMLRWQQTYEHTVIVTRGEKGSSYLDRITDELNTIPVIPVKVIDTTGAGDAFNAALSYCLASGWSIEECVSFAGKAASLSVTKFGAQSGMPTFEEVNQV